MRKAAVLVCIAFVVVLLAGCAEIVSTKPIGTEYIAAYDAMETVYGYKYDWLHGEWRYLPELKMVHHEEEFKVQYERTWSDGSVEVYWQTVGKAEYENALNEIGKGGE